MISKQLSVGAISLSNILPVLPENFQLSDDPIMLSSDLSNIDMSQLSNLSGVARVYVGEQISDYLQDPKKAKLSDDTLWFDTKEDISTTSNEIKRMDSLQTQIYRLGLQVRDVVKVVENGVIPGDSYNNTKDEMISIADFVEAPEGSQTSSIFNIYVYGNNVSKNNELYYMMFNPGGYLPKSIDKFQWIIDGHNENTLTAKTFVQYDSTLSVNHMLCVSLDSTLSSTAKIQMAAATSAAGTMLIWKTDQDSIDSTIAHLSTETLNFDFAISCNILDDFNGGYISSEYFETIISAGSSTHTEPTMSIVGNEYIDANNMELYCCKIDETSKNFTLNTNTKWFFLSNDEEVTSITRSKTDDSGAVLGSVTYYITHGSMSPVAQLSVYKDAATDIQYVKDLSVEVYVKSNYDNSLFATKTIKGVGGSVPDGTVEPTVKAVCAKIDKKSNIVAKKNTLYNGEMVFFTDTSEFAVANRNSVNEVEFKTMTASEGGGLSKEQIQDIGLDYLEFTKDPTSDVKNRFSIDSNGKPIIIQHNLDENVGYSPTEFVEETTNTKNGAFIHSKFQIGKIYCGGHAITHEQVMKKNVNPTSYISHNFVELFNGSNNDIDLNNVYLLYLSPETEYKPTYENSKSEKGWEFLKLSGRIKAGGTYLIRGACCNPERSATMNIDKCDIEWRKRISTDKDFMSDTPNYIEFTRSGDLIEFSQQKGCFFLCIASKNYDGSTYCDNIKSILNGTYVPSKLHTETTDPTQIGYNDLVGISLSTESDQEIYGEGKTDYSNYVVNAKTGNVSCESFDNLIFLKWFYMDPSKQAKNAIKDLSARANTDYMTHVDYSRHQQEFDDSRRDQLYYSEIVKKNIKPGTSLDNQGMFSTKTHFRSDVPNMVNITFGIQATYSGPTKKATRCFNWISEGYYDEYIKYRKVNDDGTYSDWSKKYYSITAATLNSDYGVDIKGEGYDFHEFYDRHMWIASDGTEVTTHKVIIKNVFEAGKYEYQIGRRDDSKYTSEIMSFSVHSDEEVNSKFSFIQTSDQQGFNFIEYQAWKASCKSIKYQEPEFNFTINTGDIAQSGNRVSEWLDYYDGRKYINNKEEMFTIGNNDLCGKSEAMLGDGEDATSKFNLINIKHFYTFELDKNNPYYVSTIGSNKYPLYSLYSFEYGQWHFISLVSEIREMYYTTFAESFDAEKGLEFAKHLNSDVENWLLKDLTEYRRKNISENDCKKCIVFMHEMPFTIVTTGFYTITHKDWKEYGRSILNKGSSWTFSAATGCKLNLETGKGNYRISRIFKKAGIRLVFGGHKHTFSLSNPIYDAGVVLSIDNENFALSDSYGYLYDKETKIPDRNEDPFLSAYIGGDQDDLSVLKYSRQPVVEFPIDGVRKLVRSKSTDVDITLNSELCNNYITVNSTDDDLSIRTNIRKYINSTSSIKRPAIWDETYAISTDSTGLLSNATFSFIRYNKVYELISNDINLLSSYDDITRNVFLTAIENVVSTSYIYGYTGFNCLNVYNNTTTDLSTWLRINYVSSITAPTYVMSQATGYKVISNKELPAPITQNGIWAGRYTPWLLSYCAATKVTKADSGTAQWTQQRPTYIRYDFDEDSISVQIKQLSGVLNFFDNGKSITKKDPYTLEKQGNEICAFPLTFGKYGNEKYDSIESNYISVGSTYTQLSIINDISSKIVKLEGKVQQWIDDNCPYAISTDSTGLLSNATFNYHIDKYMHRILESQPTINDDYMTIYSDYISGDTYIIKL